MYFCTTCYAIVEEYNSMCCSVPHKIFINSPEFLEYADTHMAQLPSNVKEKIMAYLSKLPLQQIQEIEQMSLDDIEINDDFMNDFYGET